MLRSHFGDTQTFTLTTTGQPNRTYTSIAQARADGNNARVWGGMHLPSVGASILLVTALAEVVHGRLLWTLVGFTATATYLLVIGVQFWLATRRGQNV